MTWNCPECGSNDVRFRSWTRDYRCNKCYHVMDSAPISKPKPGNIGGRPPKFLKVV